MPTTGIVKYHVKLKFEVDGLVEKADIIGAIFGQTEGLLGPEMNLNELQKVSKVGRIEVNVETKGNMAKGDALIPMSTDIMAALIVSNREHRQGGALSSEFGLVGIDTIQLIKRKMSDRAQETVEDQEQYERRRRDVRMLYAESKRAHQFLARHSGGWG